MKNKLKSTGAILAGIIAVFALSTFTDMILEKTGLMKLPFHSNPLWLIFIVVIYRCVFVVVGGYLTAILAPGNAMKHVWIYAGIGFILGIAGTIIMWSEPPHWYPVSLVVLGIPCALLGGKLKAV